MALSEHEQRMFDEIEQALFQEDPKFAATVDVSKLRRRRPVMGAALAIAGLLALTAGAIIATVVVPVVGIIVAVIGFLLMVAGMAILVYGLPGGKGAPTVDKRGGSDPAQASRMEDRLRKRFEGR